MATDYIGYRAAEIAIKEGRATGHALWIILRTPDERDGYALQPDPWEGPGCYQSVSYGKEFGRLVRCPLGRQLETDWPSAIKARKEKE